MRWVAIVAVFAVAAYVAWGASRADEPRPVDRLTSEPRDDEPGAAERATVGGSRDEVVSEEPGPEQGEPSYEFELVVEVVDEDGNAVPDARVTMQRAGLNLGGVTDARGMVRIRDVTGGEDRLRVRPPRGNRELGPVARTIRVLAGANRELVVLPRGRVLRGSLSWIPKWPDDPKRILLEVEDAGGAVVEAFLGEGEFEIPGLGPGPYEIRGHGGCSEFVLADVAEGRHAVLQLKSPTDPRAVGLHGGEIHGRLRGTLASAADLAMYLRAIEGGGPLVVPDSGQFTSIPYSLRVGILPQAFHFTGLREGTYELVARLGGESRTVGEPISVRAGQVVSGLVIDLPKRESR